MKTKSQNKAPHLKLRQRGAALIILMLIIVLSFITLFAFRSERKGPELEAQRKTNQVLAEAKAALLGKTASDAGGVPTPGRLSCPDSANQGNTAGIDSDGDCSTPVGIPPNAGRVPWKLLRVGDLGDGVGERLWYVVAKDFINDANPLNTKILDGNNLITITGNQSMNKVVAVIIAPGTPLQGQARDSDENKK